MTVAGSAEVPSDEISLASEALVIKIRVSLAERAAAGLVTRRRAGRFDWYATRHAARYIHHARQATGNPWLTSWPWSSPVRDFAARMSSSIRHLVQTTATRPARLAGAVEWQR